MALANKYLLTKFVVFSSHSSVRSNSFLDDDSISLFPSYEVRSQDLSTQEEFKKIWSQMYRSAQASPASKGTVSRDFQLLVFSGISYHKPLSIPLGPFRIFSKIPGDIRSSSCTTNVVDTGGKWEKSVVWTPLGSRVYLKIHFCLQVHFKVSTAWYCSHYLPLVSTTPVANWPPVPTTLAKLVAKFATRVVDTGGAPWLAKFSKKFETVLLVYSEAGGKLEKNQKQKISWHCPFNWSFLTTYPTCSWNSL